MARHGEAGQGKGLILLGEARQGVARHGTAWQGGARPGLAGLGGARQGMEPTFINNQQKEQTNSESNPK